MRTYEKIKFTPNLAGNTPTNFPKYTCTNHPEIIVNDAGLCPKCGKELVKKY